MSLDVLLPAVIGAKVTCSKTVAESDVLLFAGVTGDFSPNHIDEEAMRATPYGGRIAHGALLVGYMSRASSMICEQCPELMTAFYPVSAGYDRVRFLTGVRIGDTVTVSYRITSVDAAKQRSISTVEMVNQRGQLCAVATHLMTWLPRE